MILPQKKVTDKKLAENIRIILLEGGAYYRAKIAMSNSISKALGTLITGNAVVLIRTNIHADNVYL